MFYVFNMYNVILSYKDITIFKAGPVSTQSSAEALLIACVGKQMIADSASIIEVAEKVTVPEGYKSVEIADDVKILIKESLIVAATGVSNEKQHAIDACKSASEAMKRRSAAILDTVISECPELKTTIKDVSGGNIDIARALVDTAKRIKNEFDFSSEFIVDTSDENKANAIRMFNDDGSQTEIKLNNVRLAPDLLEIACSPVRAILPTIPTIVEGTLPHSQIPSLYDEGKGYKFDEVSGHEQSDGFGMDDVGVALPLACAHHHV